MDVSVLGNEILSIPLCFGESEQFKASTSYCQTMATFRYTQVKSAAPPPPTQQGQPVAEKKSPSSNFIKEALSKLADTHNADSDYAFSFGNLFRCLCCPREGASPNDVRFNTIMKSIEVRDSSELRF